MDGVLLWSAGILPAFGVGFGVAWLVRQVAVQLLMEKMSRAEARAETLAAENRDYRFENGRLVDRLSEFRAGPASAGREADIIDELRLFANDEEQSFWNLHNEKLAQSRVHVDRHELPILAVTNLKGGVGKSTTTLNIGAYFRKRQDKRILFIDTDYQGSLTNNLLIASGQEAKVIQTSSWMRFNIPAQNVMDTIVPLGGELEGCGLVGAGYRLNENETRSFVQWMIGETEDDLRFRLARFLASPEVREEYDLVVIDAPPRLGTAGINALCAANCFLVPTILNRLSTEPIHQMMEMFSNTFIDLNPNLRLLGVLANQTYRANFLSTREKGQIEGINEILPQFSRTAQVLTAHVPRLSAISTNAGQLIPYFEDVQVQQAFDEVGFEIQELMKAR